MGGRPSSIVNDFSPKLNAWAQKRRVPFRLCLSVINTNKQLTLYGRLINVLPHMWQTQIAKQTSEPIQKWFASGLLVCGHDWITERASHILLMPQFGQVCRTAIPIAAEYICWFCFSIKPWRQKYVDVAPITTAGIFNCDKTSHKGGYLPSGKADDARRLTLKVNRKLFTTPFSLILFPLLGASWIVTVTNLRDWIHISTNAHQGK